MFRSIFIILFFAIYLCACAHAPRESNKKINNDVRLSAQHLAKISKINHFFLKGRIGLQNAGKGFSGQFQWQHHPERDLLTFFSPLGSQVAIIEKTPQQVTLTDAKGNQLSANDLETLTQKTLGWSIPLEGLTDWSLGRPSDANIQHNTWDEQGRLLKLSQENWDIDYQSYVETHHYVLPNRLTLRRENLYLKLIIEDWSQLNEPAK